MKSDTLTLLKELHPFETPTCQMGPAWQRERMRSFVWLTWCSVVVCQWFI